MRRLFLIIVSLAFCTTLLTIQQTHKYRIHYGQYAALEPPQHVYVGQKRITLHRLEQHGGVIGYGKRRRQNAKPKLYTVPSGKGGSPAQRRKPARSEERFLLPVLFYNMGPNNLFRIFKEAIPIAKALNRTIVVPPFHHHPRMKLDAEARRDVGAGDISIEIFDETFKSVVEDNPEQVLDVKLLRRHLPVQPFSKFVAQCGRYIDLLVKCGDVSSKRETGLLHFATFNDVTVNSNLTVDSLSDVTGSGGLKINLKTIQRKSRDESCVGLAIGSKCLGGRPEWFEHWQGVSRYVKRPASVRMLANRFFTHKLKSKGFLAVHWRYEPSDWNDMCKDSRPEAVRNINNPMCDLAQKFATDSAFLHNLLTKLNEFAAGKKLKAIYISTPPQLTVALRKMKQSWTNLYTISDVEQYSAENRDEFESDVFKNNFAASFLEQEICFRSNYFLGSPLSSWTQTVLLDRVASNVHEHASVLDIVSEGDNSSYPKLTWYFPEGD